MKLPPEWKAFYLRSLQVPVLGQAVFGPLLRGLWRLIRFVHERTHRAPVPPPYADAVLTTYASSLDGLRRQVESLERRCAGMEEQLRERDRAMQQLRDGAQVQALVLTAAVQGLQQRVEAVAQDTSFQQRAVAAALSGLQRASDARPANFPSTDAP